LIKRRPLPSEQSNFPTDLHPALQRVYQARGLRLADELDLGLKHLLPLTGLLGVEQAVASLYQALQEQRRIVIAGDYDADGATASALMVRALKSFGAHQVSYLIPDRFTAGYGLSCELVEQAEAIGAQLLLTVDNGISSLAGVARARAGNIDVIVTDHHLPGESLPEALAIVNPNQPGDRFPSKALAGVGVAFYLLLALRRALREGKWFARQGISEPNLAEYLDLVCLGTVADLVPLDRNNRILVQQGLLRIRAGRCAPGILALLQVAGRDHRRITAADLGFAVGPRLNAAGRLEDMRFGVECLLSDDAASALERAQRLDALNGERRHIEAQMKIKADALMAQVSLSTERMPLGLCLFDEHWHQGVIGILASRIKDQYHRPVIAFAPGDEMSLKGSARSISGVHMRDVLALIDSRQPGLIARFGGHAMAAGLSLARERLPAFSAAFEQAVSEQLKGVAPMAEILSDGPLRAQDFSHGAASALRYAGPWGQGFPEPLFDGEFQVLSQRFVGEIHLKLALSLDGATPIDAIAFRWGDKPLPGERVRIVYRLDLNAFRGSENVQLIVEYLETV
jgi:single-stranded-DNA-specific exonuclease